MVLLAVPGRSGVFLNDWIVLIGLAIGKGVGLRGLFIAQPVHRAAGSSRGRFIARPDRKSDAPEGDAIRVAELLRSDGK